MQGEARIRLIERDNGNVPWTRAVGGRDAPARQAFERFELEHRSSRLDVI